MDPRHFPTDSEKQPQGIFSSGITVDQEGDWYYHEDRIIREDILELFLTNLAQTSDGTFMINWRGQHCALEVADTPFIVSRVDRIDAGDGTHEEILIRLKHLPDPEILDPSTLQVGEDNVPYCAIHNGEFRARFSRPAYYQLSAWIEEDPDTGSFFLEMNGRRYSITFVTHRSPEDAAHA
jgi:uncharacterized protein